jgi:hypothetical protein
MDMRAEIVETANCSGQFDVMDGESFQSPFHGYIFRFINNALVGTLTSNEGFWI